VNQETAKLSGHALAAAITDDVSTHDGA